VSSIYLLNGRLNANVAPFPSGLVCAHILPPWASTMLFEINKPNPIPLLKVEPIANFENKFGKILEGKPMPVSFIFTITSPPLPVFFFFFFSSVVMDIVPSFVNLMAFLSRFEITS
jgi:hypothetical protein